MRKRHVAAMLAVGVALGGLTGLTRADAQTVGPIQTVPGYPGCGGNSQIQDVNSEHTCANKRTFTFGAQSRTVTTVQTMRTDGTASVTWTLSAPVNFAVPVRVRSHAGVSSAPGPLVDDVQGEIAPGQTTLTLSFRYDCGQIDVKAVFTGEGDGRGRISGGYFCRPPTPTVPTTAPTTAPGSTTPTSSPGTPASSAPTSGPGASSTGTLPATGADYSLILVIVGALVVGGLTLIVKARPQEQAR